MQTVLTEAEIVKQHLLGGDCLLLAGGPYALCVAVRSKKMPYIRMPIVDGHPFVAPQATEDGSVVYDNTHKQNVMGFMIFRFRQKPETAKAEGQDEKQTIS